MTDLGERYLSWHHNGLSLINSVWSGTGLAFPSVFYIAIVKDLTDMFCPHPHPNPCHTLGQSLLPLRKQKQVPAMQKPKSKVSS